MLLSIDQIQFCACQFVRMSIRCGNINLKKNTLNEYEMP